MSEHDRVQHGSQTLIDVFSHESRNVRLEMFLRIAFTDARDYKLFGSEFLFFLHSFFVGLRKIEHRLYGLFVPSGVLLKVMNR